MIAIENIHERKLQADAQTVGQLLDSLASDDDRLWPKDRWPTMRFDRPLQVGADGGHGTVRYDVEVYQPGQRIWFRFKAPRGFHGGHGYEIIPVDEKSVILRHTIRMTISGRALLTWPFLFRPLHNALLEDSLDLAQLYAQPDAHPASQWSRSVRLLRWLLRSRRKRRKMI